MRISKTFLLIASLFLLPAGFLLFGTNNVEAQCCSDGINLLAKYNPDFQAPINPSTKPPGFYTDNNYNFNNAGVGNYSIIHSRGYGACSGSPEFDHSYGNATGQYLWYDTKASASPTNPGIAWEPYDATKPLASQNLISVAPNSLYIFSVYIRDLARESNCAVHGAPVMGLRINGVDMAQIDLATIQGSCCPGWVLLCAQWNSGSDTTVLLKIESRLGVDFTDLGIDDVFFGKATGAIQVNLGNDTTLCTGQSLLLKQSFLGASYLWSDGSTASSLNVTSAGSYWLHVQQNTCTGDDTINVKFNEPPVKFNLGNDTTICTGAVYTLFPNPKQAGNYLWQDNSTGDSIQVNKAGSYSLQVSNNCGSQSDVINVSVLSPPTLVLARDTLLCNQASFQIIPVTTGQGNYLWNNGSNSSSISVDKTGSYSVSLANNCGTATDSINVTILSRPTLSLPADTILCDQADFQITPVATGQGDYLWSNGSSSSSISVDATGLYTVSLANKCGTATDDMNVIFLTSPKPYFDSVDVCDEGAVVLDAGNAGMMYSWSNGETTEKITVSASGQYMVTITNNGSCEVTGIAVVKHHSCVCKAAIPNAFTPNLDGKNDSFKPLFNCPVQSYIFSVYNRWGQKIYESTTANYGWKGDFNGKPQPIGTYDYIVQYKFQDSPNVETLKGNVMLIR